MESISAISNVDLINYSTRECRFVFDESVFPGTGSKLQVVAGLLAKDLDAILVVNAGAQLLLTLQLYRLRGGKAAIIHWDLLLSKPVGFTASIKAFVKSLLLRNASKYICVHRDTADYEKYYRLDRQKIIYVPFKANCYDTRAQYPTTEGGYVLSCGASYRDYDTLLKAVVGINVPVKIVLPSETQAQYNNTRSTFAGLPNNVEVIRHDFDRDSWYQILAAADIVVLPIAMDAIQPAGISVYLEAMSMGKPVIVSRCPSTNGILNEDQAMLVQRGDSVALRDAIIKLQSDPALRRRIANQGKAYADSLEGVDRLVRDLATVVCDNVSAARARHR